MNIVNCQNFSLAIAKTRFFGASKGLNKSLTLPYILCVSISWAWRALPDKRELHSANEPDNLLPSAHKREILFPPRVIYSNRHESALMGFSANEWFH